MIQPATGGHKGRRGLQCALPKRNQDVRARSREVNLHSLRWHMQYIMRLLYRRERRKKDDNEPGRKQLIRTECNYQNKHN